ncbi:MAG: nitroreductase [Thermoleophilia bacterium]
MGLPSERGEIEPGAPQVFLTPDELLATTRCVRRRLDLARPVERGLLEESLRLAQQAPTGGYRQDWHFLVVTDPETRRALGELWRRGGRRYLASRPQAAVGVLSPERRRLLSSVRHLMRHIGDVPVHVLPCVEGRTEGKPVSFQAARFGSILPAAWSFMLAARARGLGTCLTTFHLAYEREAAELLGIPYEEVMQVALIPVAHVVGDPFRPARRRPLQTMVHWERW